MRSKRQRHGIAVAVLLAMFAAVPAPAANEPAETAPPAERPEHKFRPLPDDTFKPSEEVSEDFPVPFPVDI